MTPVILPYSRTAFLHAHLTSLPDNTGRKLFQYVGSDLPEPQLSNWERFCKYNSQSLLKYYPRNCLEELRKTMKYLKITSFWVEN
jgi:predicted alpha/beta hydrolase